MSTNSKLRGSLYPNINRTCFGAKEPKDLKMKGKQEV